MHHSDLTENDVAKRRTPSPNPEEAITCPVSVIPPTQDALNAGLCATLEDAGCPLGVSIRDRLAFETLLTELSSRFVNIPASRVDSQIEWGLRLVVEQLGIDRCGFGEVSARREAVRGYALVPAADRPFLFGFCFAGAIPRLRPDDSPGHDHPVAGGFADGRGRRATVFASVRAKIQFDYSPDRDGLRRWRTRPRQLPHAASLAGRIGETPASRGGHLHQCPGTQTGR